jgi:hypothetical protein
MEMLDVDSDISIQSLIDDAQALSVSQSNVDFTSLDYNLRSHLELVKSNIAFRSHNP